MNREHGNRLTIDEFEPVIYAYYDRADMLTTTMDTLHSHHLCEIMYVNEGTIRVDIDGKALIVGRHQYIWIDSAQAHRLILPEQNECAVMNIEYAFMPASGCCPTVRMLYRSDPTFAHMHDEAPRYFVLTDADETVYAMLKKVILLAAREPSPGGALSSFLCTQLLLLIARHWEAQKGQLPQPITNRYVAQALDLIQSNYTETLTVRSIAQSLSIQTNHLNRLFKKHTGMAVVDHIRAARMERARALLTQTDYTILEVASHVGFTSQQYFAQLFKRIEGVSPSEYRRHARTMYSEPS